MEGQIESSPLTDSAETSLAALKLARDGLDEALKSIQSAIREVNKAARAIEDSRTATIYWQQESE